jgi:hypothetical protein
LGEPKSTTIFFAGDSVVIQQLRDFLLNRFSFQGKVDETGAGDAWRLGNFRDIEFAGDALRYFARILAALFRQHHRGVALIIAKAWISCGRYFPGERQSRC